MCKRIQKLKSGKSQGTDGTSAELYRNTSFEMAPILCCLFNEILDSGIFPDMWCDSIIVPVHKSGSKDDPSNFRGISQCDV